MNGRYSPQIRQSIRSRIGTHPAGRDSMAALYFWAEMRQTRCWWSGADYTAYVIMRERIPLMMRWLLRLSRLWLAALFALSLSLGLGLWWAGVASAHASYVSSDPAAGAVLATAPAKVTVHFAENVNPAGKNGIPSSLQVFLKPELKNTFYSDQDATEVDTGPTQFPLSDAKSMSIAMKGAGNGIYEVYWHTVSADDGDPDSGVFFFGVGTGNVLGTSSTPATSAASTSSGTPIWVTILVGIVALVLGGGIVTSLRRRPRAARSAGSDASGTPSPGETPAEKH